MAHSAINRSSSFILLLFVCFSSFALPSLSQSAAKQAYTPVQTACPAGGSLVRSAGTGQQILSPQESAYITNREKTVLPLAWSSYYANILAYSQSAGVALPDYLISIFVSRSFENMTVGVAVSGGGYRAALVGGGVLDAFDGRNAKSIRAGTGGLLQGLSYLSGLSGGGWLVSSLTQAGFPTVPDLVFGRESDKSKSETNTYGGFLAGFDFIDPSSNDARDLEYLYDVVRETEGKKAAGFSTTMTDAWARVLARHFVNGTTSNNFFGDKNIKHGAGLLWSNVSYMPALARYAQPFPILIADSVSPHGNKSNILPDSFGVPISNPIYEFNPFEFGSFDHMLASFIPMKYLGSSGGRCWTGFDQTSYVQAISSNVFNGITTDVFNKLIKIFRLLNPSDGTGFLSAHIPNVFQGVNSKTFIDTNETTLALGDGGLDGQEVPFQPLLVKAREIDVIIGIDMASSGPHNFPSGGSLIDAGKRAALFPDAYSFPSLPKTTAEFTAQGLLTRPTFFGCSNADIQAGAPLVIYIPNTAPLNEPPVTNPSTWNMTFSDDRMQAILDQSFDIATQGIPNGNQKDPQWPICLACAVGDRARARYGWPRDGLCGDCMNRYCWKQAVAPKLVVNSVEF